MRVIHAIIQNNPTLEFVIVYICNKKDEKPQKTAQRKKNFLMMNNVYTTNWQKTVDTLQNKWVFYRPKYCKPEGNSESFFKASLFSLSQKRIRGGGRIRKSGSNCLVVHCKTKKMFTSM